MMPLAATGEETYLVVDGEDHYLSSFMRKDINYTQS